jgi:undecaprenyl diphosphate synthase
MYMILKKKSLPSHVAIIMDGNRRWARKNKKFVWAGHRRVVDEILEPLVRRAAKLGVKYITFWAWSTENWKRSVVERQAVMALFREGLKRDESILWELGVRLKFIGDISRFPKDIAKQVEEWVEKTENNKGLTVVFALNYGGHDEVIRAIQRMNQDLRFKNQDLKEKLFEKYLDTEGMPDPDLIIRTGGEKRLSGFMSWQSAYSELYFTKVLMPDFTVEEFDRALLDYQNRQRRFGK